MLARAAFVLAVCVILVAADNSKISWDAKKTLLSLDDDDLNITKIVGTPTPIYRKDLQDVYPDYIAYWEVKISDKDYVIVSAGPKTADYKIVMEGEQPTLVDDLLGRASTYGKECGQIYMLVPSPDIILMCEDKNGDVVATTEDDDVAVEDENANNYTNQHNFIESNLQALVALWEERAQEVKDDGIWSDETHAFNNIDETNEDYMDIEYDYVIGVGQKDKFPVDDPTLITIKVHDENVNLETLCGIIKVCNGNNIDASKVLYTEYGQGYVILEPSDGDVELANGVEGISFELEVKQGNQGDDVIKNYFLDLNRRTKRQSWSAWTRYSIPDGHLFPHYRQHRHSRKRCSVGCGPVAWTMIFGYLDRRSHLKPSTYGTGSQGLFRCGSTGTSGSNQCMAPKYNNLAITKYTETLHSVLKTFCIFGNGATWPKNMDRVKSFFVQRQTTGSPKISFRKKTFLGIPRYRSYIRNLMIDHLRKGWPSIVGLNLNGIFSGHYPVATQYKQRSRRVRKCRRILFWKRCKWETQWSRYMFLHMGWGGSRDGWRPAKAWLAAAAMY